MNFADNYIKQHRRNAVHPGTAFLCPEEQVREIEYLNQQRLTEHVETLFVSAGGTEPFSVYNIAWMHRLTVEGLYSSAGQLRAGADTVHIPGASFTPSPATDVEYDLRDLLDEVRESAEFPATVATCLLRAARYFHRFLTIHPFLDGNGRVGRAFLHLMLYEYKLLAPPEQIYDYIESERYRYYEALTRADRGDITPLVTMITDALIEVNRQAAYDSIRESPLGTYVMSKLSSNDRKFMMRSQRRRHSRETRERIANRLSRKVHRILAELKTELQKDPRTK